MVARVPPSPATNDASSRRTLWAEDGESGAGSAEQIDHMKHLKTLFVAELGTCFSSEARLAPALAKMAVTAASPSLERLIRLQGHECERNVKDLEGIFEACGEKARGKRCEAIAGILVDGDKFLALPGDGPALDAALIATMRKIIHWEIASYSSLAEYAGLLDQPEAAGVLKGILDKKTAAEKSLAGVSPQHGSQEGTGKLRARKVPR